MATEPHRHEEWSAELFTLLRDAGVDLFTHVPDAGNDRLIGLAEESNDTRVVLLTSEEEGVAICAGADLVGGRGVICMQSSGLGNCPNILSLAKGARFPILMMITRRGDYGEQNPWQYPMGEATDEILRLMGVNIFRVDYPHELEQAVTSAVGAVWPGAQSAAIVLSQKFLGSKAF